MHEQASSCSYTPIAICSALLHRLTLHPNHLQLITTFLQRVNATRSLSSPPMSKRSSPPPSTSNKPATKKPTLDTMTVPQVLPATSFLIQKLSAKAKTPTRGSALAAGYDLYS